MIKWLWAFLNMIPFMIIGAIVGVCGLVYMIFKVPADRYNEIMYGKKPKPNIKMVEISKEHFERIIKEKQNGEQKDNDTNE